MPPTEQSVQDRFFPTFTCFGCGPANDAGLRLKSYAEVAASSARCWTATARPRCAASVNTAAAEGEMTADVQLAADGKVRATGVAVWKRFRPRLGAAR